MKCTLVSKDWSLNWCQVTDEEIAMCLKGLRELHHGFGLHSLISFFVFLD